MFLREAQLITRMAVPIAELFRLAPCISKRRTAEWEGTAHHDRLISCSRSARPTCWLFLAVPSDCFSLAVISGFAAEF